VETTRTIENADARIMPKFTARI